MEASDLSYRGQWGRESALKFSHNLDDYVPNISRTICIAILGNRADPQKL